MDVVDKKKEDILLGKVLKEKALIIVLVIFSIMIFSLCFQDTINYDEYFSMQWCRLGWKDLMQQLIDDVHPPLYYLVLKLVLDLSGESMFCARLLSAVAGIGILWSGALFLEADFGKKPAVFFAHFIYLNPFMIQKATEIRMYMLASLFVILSVMELYMILKNPIKKHWILFTLFSLLATYTHYYALLSMIFLYAGAIVYFIFARNKKEIFYWLICSGVTILCYLPWLPIALRQVMAVNNNFFWISMPSSRLGALRELFDSVIPYTEHIYLVIIIFLTGYAFINFVITKSLQSYWAIVCGSTLWGILTFCIWYSIYRKPILISRYLIMAVCISVLGISVIAKYLNKYFIITVCVFCLIVGAVQYQAAIRTQSNRNTSGTVAFADENVAKEDVVLYVDDELGYISNCMKYYLPDITCVSLGKNLEEALDNSQISSYLVEENKAGGIWFFDSEDYIKEQEIKKGDFEISDLIIEDCGGYGFNSTTFEIYRLAGVN